MKYALILISLLTVVVSCSSSSDQPLGSEPPGLLRNQVVDILGKQRSYHLFVPDDPDSASMVFLLHGNRGSSDQLLGLVGQKAPYKNWMDIALHQNLLLVVPDGSIGINGFQGWNDCRSDAQGNPEGDDVLFISTLIDDINVKYQRTETKVFAVGTSNGGMMVMRLAEEIPNKLFAFASIAASSPVHSKCVTSTVPLSALIMNGTADPILPYNGGQIKSDRGEVYSTMDTIGYWISRNQVSTLAVETEVPDDNLSDNSTVKTFSYFNNQNNSEVIHYEIIGGGHTEPSITERYSRAFKLVVGNQNGDIEASEEIWNFFSSL